jgi:hypothetical protein
MTDLPQLQSELVRAAAKRNRRARVLHGTLAGVAVAVVAGAASAAVVGDRDDGSADEVQAVPSPYPTTPKTVEEAFGVFRRAERPGDRLRRNRVPGGGPHHRMVRPERTRFVARVGGMRYFLAETKGDLCLIAESGGGGCGPKTTYLDGHKPQGTFTDAQGESIVVFVFPDGVREAELTLDDGQTLRIRVRNNAFARKVRSRVAAMRWVAPDGKPEKLTFTGEPGFDPADFYSILKRPERPTDRLEGAPGARLATRAGDAKVYVHSDLGAICVRLSLPKPGDLALVGGCRRKAGDVRRGLIVVVEVARGRRLLTGAFPDGVSSVELLRSAGNRRLPVKDNVMPIVDAEGVSALRYVSPGRTTVIDRIPRSSGPVVLNARKLVTSVGQADGFQRQTALLEVLRRRTAADDDPQVAATVRDFRDEQPRVGSARLLAKTPSGSAYVLVPVRKYMASDSVAGGRPGRPKEARDGLCLVRRGAQGGAGTCVSTDDLLRGRARGALAGFAYGLVPDVVRQVRPRPGDPLVRVRRNFYVYDVSGWKRGLNNAPEWYDADGRIVKQRP